MKILKLLDQQFPFLDSVRNRWILIIFSLVFSIFFINVFVPWNINRWNNDSGIEEFIHLSGFGVIAALVLLISQFSIRKLVRLKHFRIWTFAVWVFCELFVMATLFSFYQASWDVNINRFFQDIPNSFKYTLLAILIPYSLIILFLSYVTQKSKLKQLAETKDLDDKAGLINFMDEKGNVRFSILGDQILYLESADNYVVIYYKSDERLAKQMLRNSMKNIESFLTNSNFKRCHRSFMVNLQKIEFIEFEKSTCRIKLFGLENFIPVSRKFFPEFRSFTIR
ncbi:LytTR family DNA-binding domain-containing protein [Sunxiuqinia sp. A32]|uniref:LytTR family DNA-binding domain-containing protein n=1 Tax=Sunxiuqinia sp. A32 TaxID=3461496 RepID=UPI004045E015